MFQNSYEINSKTNSILAITGKGSIIFEGVKEIYNPKKPQAIINHSCKYYGSTYDGRLKTSQAILGTKYKLPIAISESKDIIMFPTKSFYDDTCSWISFNNIVKYEEINNKVCIYFKEGSPQIFDISLKTLEIEILRASKLLLILKSHNEEWL